MLFLMLAGFQLSACLGQTTGRHRERSGSGTVLAVVLCLSGLLTGFAFFISVVGLAAREKAETHEVQAVGRAWQYSGLLNDVDRETSRQILRAYLNDRIHYFQENSSAGLRAWEKLARNRQQALWQVAAGEASVPVPSNNLSVLNTYSGLSDCMTQTQSVWRRQLPDAAWWVLVLFTLSLCYLVGYRLSRENKTGRLMLFVPVLMALALFVIAEVDLPGQGIIHVTTDGLESLAEDLRLQ